MEMKKSSNIFLDLWKTKQIQAYLITETHLEGDFIKNLTNNYLFIHHAPKKQEKARRGGVAIILSPEFPRCISEKSRWDRKKNYEINGGASKSEIGNLT